MNKTTARKIYSEVNTALNAESGGQALKACAMVRALLRPIVNPPRVSINKEQRLYVIPGSCGGFSCLGFDVVECKIAGVLKFMELEPEIRPARVGTLARYHQYALAMKHGAVYAGETGKRCEMDLEPQLIGLEGKRVEVTHNGEKRRFIVGKSTGWMPCHLEIANRASSGGGAACLFPGDTVEVVA